MLLKCFSNCFSVMTVTNHLHHRSWRSRCRNCCFLLQAWRWLSSRKTLQLLLVIKYLKLRNEHDNPLAVSMTTWWAGWAILLCRYERHGPEPQVFCIASTLQPLMVDRILTACFHVSKGHHCRCSFWLEICDANYSAGHKLRPCPLSAVNTGVQRATCYSDPVPPCEAGPRWDELHVQINK